MSSKGKGMVVMQIQEKLYPDSPEAVSQIILDAQVKGEGIIPCGKGHLVNKFVASSKKPVKFVSTTNLNKIEDLDARNLSVKVQAGMTLADLDNAIKDYNLFLPITTESHGHRTLGGLVVEDAAGYESYAFDTIQNHILGLEFVTPYGAHVKTGGKTVKNVSGYDFTRLFARSWGTLGFITAITFKLRPRLEKRAVLVVELPSLHEAYQLTKTIKEAKPCLTAMKVYKEAETTSPWKLVINLGGFAETVEKHLDRLQEASSSWHHQSYPDSHGYWSDYYQKTLPGDEELMTVRGGKKTVWLLAEAVNQISSLGKVSFCEIDLGIGEIKFAAQKEHHREVQQSIINLTENFSLSYDWVKPPMDPVYRRLKQALDPEGIMFPCHKWFGGEDLD